jgi:hypothetical protein
MLAQCVSAGSGKEKGRKPRRGDTFSPSTRRDKPSSITFNVGAPTFLSRLPILLAEPRRIPPQQLATLPDLIRNHMA